MKKILSVLFLFSLSLFLNAGTSQAASLVTVSPSILQVDLSVDKPQTVLTYKNSSSQTVELDFSAQDFKDLEDGWQVDFLSPKDATNYKYSLSSWISFDKKSLILEPGEQESLLVSIDANRLTPGGHYASIQAQIRTDSTEVKPVQINGILSSLLFVRAGVGEIKEIGSISDFETNKGNFWTIPNSFSLHFQNSGNVDLTPYGLILIKDPLGRIVEKGIVNEGSLITLPESIRRYDVTMRQQAFSYLPGIYQAKLSIHFGKSNQYLNYQSNFFSQGDLNWILIAAGALLIILICWKLLAKKPTSKLQKH